MDHLVRPEGGLRPDAVILGESTHGDIAIGHRGRSEVEIVVYGLAGHASAPDRAKNALDLLPAVLAGVRDLAGRQESDAVLGPSSVAATGVDAAPASLNVIPDRVTVTLDWRILPEDTGESLKASVAQGPATPPGPRRAERLARCRRVGRSPNRHRAAAELHRRRDRPAHCSAPASSWTPRTPSSRRRPARLAHATAAAPPPGCARGPSPPTAAGPAACEASPRSASRRARNATPTPTPNASIWKRRVGRTRSTWTWFRPCRGRSGRAPRADAAVRGMRAKQPVPPTPPDPGRLAGAESGRRTAPASAPIGIALRGCPGNRCAVAPLSPAHDRSPNALSPRIPSRVSTRNAASSSPKTIGGLTLSTFRQGPSTPSSTPVSRARFTM